MSEAEYIRIAMSGAKFQTLADGSVYGEIPGFDGVWSNAATREDSEAELADVLEDWIDFRASENLSIPEINGCTPNFAIA